MSTNIDCVIFLKSKLENELTKLCASPKPNIPTAQMIQSILATAHNISDGHFARIEPLYEPITPKLMLTVKALNEAIVSGGTSVTDFDEYIAVLVEALRT